MISLALKNILEADADLMSFIGSAKIFAERGRGDRNIQIRSITAHKIVDEIDDLRHSTVQVLVRGWKPKEANLLAEQKIAPILSAFRGSMATDCGTYIISDIDFRAYPTIVYEGDDQVISMNAKVYYKYRAP